MQNNKQEQQERNEVMVMTLCHLCVNNFMNSGYIVVQRGFSEKKETCDFCNVRQGLTYGVFGTGKGEGGG